MTVKRLKKEQRGPWCSYCGGKVQRAVHRGCGFRKFSCSDHLSNLTADDLAESRQSNYQTEGEYQALRNY
jgi:hypothetical protein